MSEYVECVAKVTLTAEDPLWRRICRIAAELFKRCIVIAVADPDAPTWDKTPVEGIFLSRKVENHE